jgi:small-conductance mechanosensitive channel
VLGRRRVDFIVSVAQAADLKTVRDLLESVMKADDRVSQSPPAAIDVAEITDASVKLHVRPWTTVEHYPKVAADTMEKIRDAMQGAGLKYSVTLAPAA